MMGITLLVTVTHVAVITVHHSCFKALLSSIRWQFSRVGLRRLFYSNFALLSDVGKKGRQSVYLALILLYELDTL